MGKACYGTGGRVEEIKQADIASLLSKCLVTEQYRVHCKMSAVWVSFVCRVRCAVSLLRILGSADCELPRTKQHNT
jgi:hypothetical protein